MPPRLKDLPKRERVLYKRNPLVEVVAAVRVPPILALLQEPPVDFQLQFAEKYPVAEFVISRPFVFGHAPNAAAAAAAPSPDKPLESTTCFRFSTRDKSWTVSMEANLFALTCSRYTEWAEFRSRFAEIVAAFLSLYKVQLVNRIGLRYRDVINKKELGLESTSWDQLLRPEVLSSLLFFTDALDEKSPANLGIDLEIPPGRVRIGLSAAANSAGGAGLMIDTDCYSEQQMDASADALMGKAEAFHAYTSSVFQACISDTLHAALSRAPEGGSHNG